MNSQDKSKIIFTGNAWVRETATPAPDALRPLPAPGLRQTAQATGQNDHRDGPRPLPR